MVKSLQGTPWDRLAGRPAGKTSQESSSSTARCDTSDASERCSAKAQDFTLPVVLHVVPVPRAADTENEPSSAFGPRDMDHGGAQEGPASHDHVQVRASTPAPRSPYDRTNQGGKPSVQPGSQPEQSKSNVSSGVKRDARAVEVLGKD